MTTGTTKTTETTLSRYFHGYVENIFMAELGFCNPDVTDYIAELLGDFTHMDRLHQLRDAQGTPINQVATMLEQAVEDGNDVLGDSQKYAIYRHIGDFCLFWTGIFPEQVSQHGGPDCLLDYCEQGSNAYRRAYAKAAESVKDREVLLFLSCEFNACVYGLQAVCKDWRRDSDDTPGGPILI